MSSKSRESVGKKNQRLLEEVERLRTAEARLIGENAGLRGDREELIKEVCELKKKSSDDEARIHWLQESYRELMDEKVGLAERMAGPAKLPLEILLNIAGFVAGSNHYGTLLAFCCMSKRIKKETESIFYETVLISEVSDLHRESGSEKPLDAYRFTKFIYTWDFIPFRFLTDHFPNIRGVIRLKVPFPVELTSLEEEDPKVFTSSLAIYRPIRSATLSSLYHCSVSSGFLPSAKPQPIESICGIHLIDDGAIVGENPHRNDLAVRSLTKYCEFSTWKLKRHEGIRESLRELGRFLPAMPENETLHEEECPSPRLEIWLGSVMEIDMWLVNLPDIIRRQPCLIMELKVDDNDRSEDVIRAELQERCVSVVATFQRIWQALESENKFFRPQLPQGYSFFSMQYTTTRACSCDDLPRDAGTRSVNITGQFDYISETDSIAITLEVCDIEHSEGGEFFAQSYAVQDTETEEQDPM